MGTPSSQDVTRLLRAWSEGDPAALEELTRLVDSELRRLAHAYMRRERQGQTLQTTALVNEAYLRLIDSSAVQWEDRAHFYGVCARLMRRILVDRARSRRNLKRGGGTPDISLDEAAVIAQGGDPDLVALDDALNDLARIDRRKGQVVELRYFGGLSVEETAECLNISPETVMRDWRLAKMWLRRELKRGGGG